MDNEENNSFNASGAMQLYRVTFKVRPSKHHPGFYEWEDGFLNLCLFGASVEDAGERAVTIVGQLPYERAEEKEKWDESWKAGIRLAGGSKLPEFLNIEKTAREVGIGICLHCTVVGEKIPNFDQIDPL